MDIESRNNPSEPLPPARRSLLKRVFISPAEPRLRAGWRLMLQTLFLLFFTACAVFPLGLASNLITAPEMLYLELMAFFGVTLSIFLARRLLDKQSFTSLGLKLNGWALLDLLAGFIIPLFILGLIFTIELAAGWLTVERFAWDSEPLTALFRDFIFILAAYILVGWNEELLSRGYHLQTLTSGLNKFWGVLLSSVVFGILHVWNPNADHIWLVFAGITLAGLFLAFGYLRTNQLWLPIGLHIGWNFFEGTVFGFPVSGQDFYTLVHTSVTGPQLWTGGDFGPEAGLLLLPALGLGFALVYFYSRWRLDTSARNTMPDQEVELP